MSLYQWGPSQGNEEGDAVTVVTNFTVKESTVHNLDSSKDIISAEFIPDMVFCTQEAHDVSGTQLPSTTSF